MHKSKYNATKKYGHSLIYVYFFPPAKYLVWFIHFRVALCFDLCIFRKRRKPNQSIHEQKKCTNQIITLAKNVAMLWFMFTFFPQQNSKNKLIYTFFGLRYVLICIFRKKAKTKSKLTQTDRIDPRWFVCFLITKYINPLIFYGDILRKNANHKHTWKKICEIQIKREAHDESCYDNIKAEMLGLLNYDNIYFYERNGKRKWKRSKHKSNINANRKTDLCEHATFNQQT